MTVLCDLDGVIYRGATALPGVPDALHRLSRSKVAVYFITNNSTRTPQATAEKITRLTGAPVEASRVFTSSMAAATLLEESDSPVLIVGEDGVRAAVSDAGLAITEVPAKARAVVVGLTRSFSYQSIAGAMDAIRNGARFIASNNDPTFPTERGLAPGAGAMVAAIAAATGAKPEVAGKPNEPMRELIRSTVGDHAWVIGDRSDTDIALAAGQPGWRSILVLTGVTSGEEATGSGADFVVADFSAAVDLVIERLEAS